MDKRTAEALEKSIEHWARNMKAEKPEDATYGRDHCALCGLFWEDHCDGCPVAKDTERVGCMSTPYGKAALSAIKWSLGEGTREAFHAAAKAEHDFLVSLREEVAEDEQELAQ